MKILCLLTCLLSLGYFSLVNAQDTSQEKTPTMEFIYPGADSLLFIVERNNKSLKAAREFHQVTQLEARTGNAPPNPEVEMGYLFGEPSSQGNRIDISIKQKFDFPTSYVHRSRLRDIKFNKAELEYIIKRQAILLRAKQLWVERLYLNQLDQLLARRLGQAEKMQDHFQLKMDAGEVPRLSISQSKLQVTALRSEHQQIQMKIRNNQVSLDELCGGISVQVIDTIFPLTIIQQTDTIQQDYNSSPQMQLYRRNLELKSQEKKLTVSKNWPKLSAGYYSESVLNTSFRGFKLGVSIPLWGNANTIKQAKSEIILAEADAQNYESIQHMEITQLVEELVSLQLQIQQLENALASINDEELLNLGLEAGEISFTEYLYASELYFRNYQVLLELKKDHLLLEAELMKIYL